MQALGSIAAFLLPFFLIDTDKSTDPEKVKDQISNFLMVHLGIAGFLLFLVMGLFKENEHSQSEETKDGEETISTGEKMKFLFKDSVYVSMFLSASLVFGLLPALGNSVSPIITAWGLEEVSRNVESYPQFFGAIGSAAGVILGIVSSLVYAIFFLQKAGQFIIF